jgi:hypothetical protein
MPGDVGYEFNFDRSGSRGKLRSVPKNGREQVQHREGAIVLNILDHFVRD